LEMNKLQKNASHFLESGTLGWWFAQWAKLARFIKMLCIFGGNKSDGELLGGKFILG
jgi:hypothetical protein